LLLLLVPLVASACDGPATPAEGEGEGEGDVCTGSLPAPVAISIVNGAVVEASGIVASPTTPGLLWLHNDSGDDAQLYAVATDGPFLGTVMLPGVTAIDLEDLAAGPCPDGSGACLWVADVGDNDNTRATVAVYAAAEPAVDITTVFGLGRRHPRVASAVHARRRAGQCGGYRGVARRQRAGFVPKSQRRRVASVAEVDVGAVDVPLRLGRAAEAGLRRRCAPMFALSGQDASHRLHRGARCGEEDP
jgi:hypothetical protein